MTADGARVDWTVSYLERHANDVKPTAPAALQPSLWDAMEPTDQGGDASRP